MDKHITALGALFIGLGILGLIGILVVLIVFGLGSAVLGTVAVREGDVPLPLVFLPAAFGAFIALIIALTTIPNFAAAYGLLKRRSWARILTLIVAILNLPVFPHGTLVGAYAVWVLVQEETQQLLPTGSRPQNEQ